MDRTGLGVALMGEDEPRPRAAGEARKRTLSPPRKRLVELMQRINFGRIEGLGVRGGEPVFGPPARVIRTWKSGGDNAARPQLQSADFGLKREVVEFFGHLDRLGDGVVRCVDIRYGLPVQAEIEEPNQA